MEYLNRKLTVVLTTVLLCCIPVIACAAPVVPDSSITYTITLREDGSAGWHVEYRVQLLTDEDMDAFDSYEKNVSTSYLPQFQDLMQRSAAQASAATSRPMDVSDFTGNAVVQTSPTGRYGVVLYSFTWKGFAKAGTGLYIGDAFAGGLYLAKDHTLIIQYPPGYTVRVAEPAPDQVRSGVIWYGQRSFGTGEPRLVIEKEASPVLPALVGIVSGVIILGGLYKAFSKKRSPEPVEPDDPPATLSETELFSLEERIIQLLKTSGGELYQSDIVKNLGLPKSTVSATLNTLHSRGVIQKVKKGRENLIRLT